MAELSVDSIIRISTSIAPAGLARKETGRTLFLTPESLPNEDRVRSYTSFAGLADDFAVDSNPYKAGQAYFSQSPYPRNFMVGTKRPDDGTQTPAIVTGDAVSTSNKEALNLIANAGMGIGCYYGGPSGTEFIADEQITVGNIIGLSMDQLAIVMQDKINTAFAAYNIDFTVEWNDVQSKMSITALDANPAATYVTTLGVTGGQPAGTEGIGGILMLRSTDDAVSENGAVSSPETIADALDAIVDADPSFTFVCEDPVLSDTDAVKDIASWCLANRVYLASSASSAPNVLTAEEDTVFNDLYVSQNGSAFGTWSAEQDFKHVSACARLSSVNFSASNSLITMNLKQLPTCTPDSITEGQTGILNGQNVNRYVTRSGVDVYETGKSFSNDWWIDTKYWTIWFENAVKTAVFNLLYQSPKVDQTEAGMNAIKSVIEAVCDQGKRNGGIAGGTLSAALTNDVRNTTGNLEFDGVLANGYFVYSEPIAEQDQSERVQRKGTPIKVWLKGSGAIQEIDIAVVLEQ